VRPPEIKGLRGIGAAVQLLRDPRAFIDRQGARLGRVWTTPMPDGGRFRTLYWMLGRDANERILSPEHKADFNWYGGYRSTMEPLIGRDVLTLLDDAPGCPAHRDRMRRLAPIFRGHLDDEYAATVIEPIVARCMR